MANYTVTAFKEFIKSNHDFSKGQGPEIRDWSNGGHSLFCHKDGVDVRVDSPKDASKLSVAFVARSLGQADLVVISGVSEEDGILRHTVIDRREFAPDTVTSASDWGF